MSCQIIAQIKRLLCYHLYPHIKTACFKSALSILHMITFTSCFSIQIHITHLRKQKAHLNARLPRLIIFPFFTPCQKMKGHLRLLNIACAAKAKWRQITLQKASRESPLYFSVQGGSERGFGIFVESVEAGSKAAETGLKRGDQVSGHTNIKG